MLKVNPGRIGLNHGFVRFGTVPFLILRALHSHGPLRLTDLVHFLDMPKGTVSVNIRRLYAAEQGLIYWHGYVRYGDDDAKLQSLWGLRPRSKLLWHEPVPSTESGARWRRKKPGKIESVWKFRPVKVKAKCKPITK